LFKILDYPGLYINLASGNLKGNTLIIVDGIGFLIITAVIALGIWILVMMLKYDSRSYLYLGLLSIISFSTFSHAPDFLGMVTVSIMLALSVFLKRKLFPNIPLVSVVPKAVSQ